MLARVGRRLGRARPPEPPLTCPAPPASRSSSRRPRTGRPAPGSAAWSCRTASSRRRSSCRWAPTPRSRRCTPTRCATAGATIMLANTYHLYLRPGHERIRASAGCTRSWAGTGRSSPTRAGSRSSSLGDLRVIDDDGVTFKSHLDGSIHRFTPEHSIAVQEALGPDIAVAFDQPVFPSSPREVVVDAMRAPTAGRSAPSRRTPGTDQALFGIVQGGLDPDLRAESARFIAGLPFDGINIGGLAGDETPDERNATLDADDPVARRRPAAALPHGPRLAARPARGGPPRHRPVRLRAARRGSRATASCGCPEGG